MARGVFDRRFFLLFFTLCASTINRGVLAQLSPLFKVRIHRVPFGKLSRQKSPQAADAKRAQNASKDLVQVYRCELAHISQLVCCIGDLSSRQTTRWCLRRSTIRWTRAVIASEEATLQGVSLGPMTESPRSFDSAASSASGGGDTASSGLSTSGGEGRTGTDRGGLGVVDGTGASGPPFNQV